MSETIHSSNTAYFDTNIWVAYILGETDPHSFVNNLVERMLKEEYCVYVSDLVIMETINSFRRKIPIKIKTTTESSSSLEKKITEKTLKYVTALESFRREGKIVNKNPPMSVKQLHRFTTKYLERYFGSVEKHGRHYRYKGLNHWDIQHALIARSFGTKTFYTADSSFEELKKSQVFNPMKFVINAPQPHGNVSA